MSKKNRERRLHSKYRCPWCANPFNDALVEECEDHATEVRKHNPNMPAMLAHSCACGNLSCRENGVMRRLTPAEELRWRIEQPHAAAMADFAIGTNAPDMIGLVIIETETP